MTLTAHQQALKAAKEAFQRTDDVEVAVAAYLRMLKIFGCLSAVSILDSNFPKDLAV